MVRGEGDALFSPWIGCAIINDHHLPDILLSRQTSFSSSCESSRDGFESMPFFWIFLVIFLALFLGLAMMILTSPILDIPSKFSFLYKFLNLFPELLAIINGVSPYSMIFAPSS